MLRLHAIFLLILSCLCISATSQNAYNFWRDDTVLRHKLLDESIRKKQVLIATSQKQFAKDYKEIYDHQFDEIEDMWKGTRTVTSPEINNYLQSIVKKIFAAIPNCKKAMPALFLHVMIGPTR